MAASTSTVVAVLLVVLSSWVVAVSEGAFTPAKDVPYEEIVSSRFTNKGETAVAFWGSLPTSTIYAVEAGQLGDATPTSSSLSLRKGARRGAAAAAATVGTYMLATDGLYWAEWSKGYESVVHNLGLSFASSSNAASMPSCTSANACQLVMDGTKLVALAAPNGMFFIDCSATALTCKYTTTIAATLGPVNSTAYVSGGVSGANVWVAAATGLWRVSTGGLFDVPLQVLPDNMWAVAHSPATNILAAGNSEKLWLFDTASISMSSDAAAGAAVAPFRWEWVTQISTASGGAIDDVITGLAFDSAGVLYIANPTCLNIRAVNGSISRLAGLEGLPYNHLTAVAVGNGDATLEKHVWLSSTMGAMRWDTAAPGTITQPSWRYFYGPRYHPGHVVMDVATHDNTTVLATDQGIAVLQGQSWTLAQKADAMEVILNRHNRIVGEGGGLISDCGLKEFGNYSSCHNADSDNNGLWTSLVVAAETFRYHVTGEAEAQSKAQHYFTGMKFLNDVTGIKGLMARSAVVTGTPHQNGAWHKSTAYPGWTWKGDTSSDEVTGHMFAYQIFSSIATNATYKKEAETLIYNIAHYITSNGFTLVDVTGRPTTWGHWNPAYLNANRTWSDERGVNSLQILAFLSTAYATTGDELFKTAYETLTNATNQYHENLLNAKIESPDDDNYSDDELTFLPYYEILTANVSGAPFDRAPALASLGRTWDFVRPYRSDLWGAINTAVTGDAADGDIEGILWNLRTWPLELVDWPVHNSNRTDIRFNPGINRFMQTRTDSVRVLPAYERDQLRWNANPHGLDGGSGMSEGDPGAWLLPYWLARYHKIIV